MIAAAAAAVVDAGADVDADAASAVVVGAKPKKYKSLHAVNRYRYDDTTAPCV